jgi:hypothetical protein
VTCLLSKHTVGSLFAGVLLGGCAIPATQVAVPTESMRDALQQARSAHQPEPANDAPPHRPLRSAAPPGAPRPMLSPPDVRMAYLYEWIDEERNKHFGGWVAIPLAGFDWVMDDGSSPPVGTPGTESVGSGSPR